MQMYVIIDGDSINGTNALNLIEYIKQRSNKIKKIVVASKNEKVIEVYRSLSQNILYSDVFIGEQAGSLKNHADIICGVWIGKIISEITIDGFSDKSELLIASFDKLVISTGVFALNAGIKIHILKNPIVKNIPYDSALVHTFDISSEKKPKYQKNNIILPNWYNNPVSFENMLIGLICIETPITENIEPPTTIPFNNLIPTISIGRQADISLEAWDHINGLYPKHVVIKYNPIPNSNWSIQSLHGFRRGKKQVSINDRIISAQSGEHPISDGNILNLGEFKFIFKADKKEALIRYESPKDMVEKIELFLFNIVSNLPNDCIPDNVNEKIKQSAPPNWTEAYFIDYQKVICENWNNEVFALFKQQFESKAKFKKAYGKINNLRNIAMHPSRGKMSYDDKCALVDFYLHIFDPYNHNRVNNHFSCD